MRFSLFPSLIPPLFPSVSLFPLFFFSPFPSYFLSHECLTSHDLLRAIKYVLNICSLHSFPHSFLYYRSLSFLLSSSHSNFLPSPPLSLSISFNLSSSKAISLFLFDSPSLCIPFFFSFSLHFPRSLPRLFSRFMCFRNQDLLKAIKCGLNP